MLYSIDKNSLELKKIKPIKILIIPMFTLLLGYIFASLTNHPNIIEKIVFDEKILVQKYNEPFSEENLKKLLIQLKVKHIDIVLAQSKIETSHYKSQVFLENKNLFGMRFPNQRITTAIGSNLNHAMYKSWQESVIDYAIYQSTFLKDYSKQEYLEYLKINYATDKNYVNIINKIIN